MRRLILCLLLCVPCSGCDEPPALPLGAARAIELPEDLRGTNYTVGRRRSAQGSCLHVAVQNLLRWHGMDAQADYWRANYGGPATIRTVAAIADRLGIAYTLTTDGDAEFLEAVSRRELGAAIYWHLHRPGDHAIVFCGFEDGQAVLLGVNRPEIGRVPKEDFLRTWRQCGGCAFAVLPPGPPEL